MSNTIKNHPSGNHPLALYLNSTDRITTSGVEHRHLEEQGCRNDFLDFIVPILQTHHIDAVALERKKALIRSFKINNLMLPPSPYPKSSRTQRGNFAEIFLAEYLQETTDAHMPVYRLRYNPNVDQSMKGDDVLLFDVDSDPIRVIVGEAKFRGVPSKQVVIETVDGLLRSNKAGLPISLQFVADRLFDAGKNDLAFKIQNCAILFATNKLKIDYVGLLMSNKNVSNHIKSHTPKELHNLLMISLGIDSPEKIVENSFSRMEAEL